MRWKGQELNQFFRVDVLIDLLLVVHQNLMRKNCFAYYLQLQLLSIVKN